MKGESGNGGIKDGGCFCTLCTVASALALAFLMMTCSGCSAVIRDADGDSKEVIIDGAGAGRFVRAVLTGK